MLLSLRDRSTWRGLTGTTPFEARETVELNKDELNLQPF
jgi:hypothetical protein